MQPHVVVVNHRYGLSDRILIKDNHLAFTMSKISGIFIDFVKNIRKNHPTNLMFSRFCDF